MPFVKRGYEWGENGRKLSDAVDNKNNSCSFVIKIKKTPKGIPSTPQATGVVLLSKLFSTYVGYKVLQTCYQRRDGHVESLWRRRELHQESGESYQRRKLIQYVFIRTDQYAVMRYT